MSLFSLGGTNGNISTNILSFPQVSRPPTGGNYIYINAKQYKRITRWRKIRKIKYAKRGKLATILLKPIPQVPNSTKAGEQSLRPNDISEVVKRSNDVKGKGKINNSQAMDTVEDGLSNNYSSTRTSMT